MSDAEARRRALDPAESFIVQAPAGSGKTELLIQRYLVLLTTVDEPEQIVAITFTRKAAAEMRHRVAAALRAAAEGRQSAEPHRRDTLRLAEAVLHRADRLGWSLTSFPRRLGIETLDALNARLARQLPALSGGAAGASVVDDAAQYYLLAARRTVDLVWRGGEPAAALRVLLERLDNSLPRLEAMLADLLPKREQWLRHLAARDEARFRAELEQGLAHCVADTLQSAAAALPPELTASLGHLLTHAARHADDAQRAQFDVGAADDGAWSPASLTEWRAVANLLLTRQGEWRRKLDRSLGFAKTHAVARERFQDVLDALAGNEALQDALRAARALPEPRYSDAEWRTMRALGTVLLHLAAELRVLFAEAQVVDFVELALAAEQALGRTDQPSELLLALDRRIQHVLVDEFQDTSHSQLRLLETLTSGWQPGDGRTLFLVGDPMQSIYRFRDADMSLFLRVRRHGIGAVRCRALTLDSNFRSAPAVVEWINLAFERAFPETDDIAVGAARFSPCTATRPPDADAAVDVHALRSADPDAELERTVDVVAEARRRDRHQSIAVLVQSRTHLNGLQERLQAAGVPVHAVEIDPLNERQVVQDLIGLTRALLHAADRIAWLGVLRAPWCGLAWRDLDALCNRLGPADSGDGDPAGGVEAGRSIIELLHDDTVLARLGDDARRRLARTTSVLSEALGSRGTLPLAQWIETTWVRLGGRDCVETAEDLDAAAQFFATLEEAAWRGDLPDPAGLDALLARPQSFSAPAGESAVEVMTIHKAKGLEFDTVVLLGLGRETRREDGRALYWMERLAADGSRDLLMAPLPEPGKDDRLARFIRRADEAREEAERARLIYVAATRARRRLHLICRLDPAADAPARRTLMATIWHSVEPAFAALGDADRVAESGPPDAVQPVLKRLAGPLPEAVAVRFAAGEAEEISDPRPEFEWASQPAVHVGTLVHRYLQRFAGVGLDGWDKARVRASVGVFGRELELLGLDRVDADDGAERVARALEGVLEDPDGRWILGPRDEAQSELRLTLRRDGLLEHVRLDRTFVERGTRWIVDFKTSVHEGGDLDAFLDSEVQRYRSQLQRYAEAMAAVDPGKPIRVGLYFPLLRSLRTWKPEPLRGQSPF